jgi:gluconolactonase
VDKGGAASNEHVLISKLDGVPGGVKTDEKGNLLLAAGGLLIYSPEGQLRRKVDLAEPASNLAFGEPDERSLFVTARSSLYRIRMPHKGAQP